MQNQAIVQNIEETTNLLFSSENPESAKSISEVTVPKLSPSEWLDEMFSQLHPSPINKVKSLVHPQCIINSPEKTMSNPYLGESFNEALDDVQSVLESDEYGRFRAACLT